MLINVLVLAFLGFSVYWWSLQGFFSSVLNFLLALLAAVVALAVWEHLALMLAGMMPESAFGVGLLLPFGAVLLGLRVAFDKFVPGNLQFHAMLDKIGGGTFGFASGVIGAGMLVIGLQFVAAQGTLMGYRGWVLGTDGRPTSATQEAGQPTSVEPLWIKVDVITAGLLNTLSNGSFAPIFSNGTLGRYHPDLAVEASFYAQAGISAKAKEGRHGLRPNHIRMLPETGYFSLAAPPSKVSTPELLDASLRTVIVGTEIDLQPTDGTKGEADPDSRFRVLRHQVALGHVSETGVTSLSYPVAYIQNGHFMKFVPGEYGRSDVQVQKVAFHWVFQIPVSSEPRWFRMKGVRMALAQPPATATEELADSLILQIGEGTEVVGNGGEEDPPLDLGDQFLISDKLPFTINKNELGTAVETSNALGKDGVAIVRGEAFAVKSKTRIGKELSVNRIFHPGDAEIVQIRLDSRSSAASLIGQVLQRAATVTQAPVITDKDGGTWFAMGYGVLKGSAGLKFAIDPNNPIRSLAQVDPGSLGNEDRLILFYMIPHGRELARLMHGDKELLDLKFTRVGK